MVTISTDTISRMNALSEGDKLAVIQLVDRLSNKPHRRMPDLLGLLSLKMVDWFSPKSKMTDEEVDEFIASVRAERRAAGN